MNTDRRGCDGEKLCDACGQRPAMAHVTTLIGGESQQTRDLCEECFEGSAAPEQVAALRQLQDTIRKGKCKYCGAAAAGGSSRENLWCKQCQQDLAEFHRRPENQLPEDWEPSDDAAMDEMSRRLDEVKRRSEEYILQRIKNRPQ